VAVAAPFTALAFVQETEAPTSIVFAVAATQEARGRYVDDVVTISVAESQQFGDVRQLSDPGPEFSPFLPTSGEGGFSAIEPRQPSVPSPGFGVFKQATPTAEPTAEPPASRVEVAPEAPPPSIAELDVPPRTVIGRIDDVDLTFYSCLGEGFCGAMANGEIVHQGAVACSFDLPLGTVLRIVGDPTERYYVCKDRGLLTATWVDVYWYDDADGWDWQAAVGRLGSIEIISLP
jgi:hypothetical protein